MGYGDFLTQKRFLPRAKAVSSPKHTFSRKAEEAKPQLFFTTYGAAPSTDVFLALDETRCCFVWSHLGEKMIVYHPVTDNLFFSRRKMFFCFIASS